MFGIGGFELFIIVLFAFVIFGPDKLPEITKIAGRFIRKFRNAKAEMDSVLQEEVIDPVMAEANKPEKPKDEKKGESTDSSSSSVSSEGESAIPSDAVAATAKKKPIPDNADTKLAEELKKQEEEKELTDTGDKKEGEHDSELKPEPKPKDSTKLDNKTDNKSKSEIDKSSLKTNKETK